MLKAFVDCHCHVFNMIDIPLYLTLSDKVKMGTIDRLKAAAKGIIGLNLFVADDDFVSRKIEEQREFLLFFERGVARNIELLATEIRDHLNSNNAWENDADILLTPLVMDFDVLLENELKSQVGREPSVREQYGRLRDAINSPVVSSIPNLKVCPFVGLDLRKLNQGKLANFQAFWDNANTLGAQGMSNLVSGNLLGIKLYPPIGFSPCPEPLSNAHRDFYDWCCKREIPITVHCQMGSYAAGRERNEIAGNTNPGNWRKLLEKYGYSDLRLNLAHLAGELDSEDSAASLLKDKSSWTSQVIAILKTYPNTYADISAFDYSQARSRKNLMQVFEKDEADEFPGAYQLIDKIVWGSDVPLVISKRSYRENQKKRGTSEYRHYIGSFLDTVEASSLSSARKTELVEKLTLTNPLKFLGLA